MGGSTVTRLTLLQGGLHHAPFSGGSASAARESKNRIAKRDPDATAGR
jgi:hypothetical protein